MDYCLLKNYTSRHLDRLIAERLGLDVGEARFLRRIPKKVKYRLAAFLRRTKTGESDGADDDTTNDGRRYGGYNGGAER